MRIISEKHLITAILLLTFSCSAVRESSKDNEIKISTYSRAKLVLKEGRIIEGRDPAFYTDSLNVECITLKTKKLDYGSHLIRQFDDRELLKLGDLRSLKLGNHLGIYGTAIGGTIGYIIARFVLSKDLFNGGPIGPPLSAIIIIPVGICLGSAGIGYLIGSQIYIWENYDLSRYQSFIPPIDNSGFRVGFSVPIKRW